MATINSRDKRGSQFYPFLNRFPDWRITTGKPGELQLPKDLPRSLEIIKSDQHMIVSVPGFDGDYEATLEAMGLVASLHKGPHVLSKRLGRLMRPFIYAAFIDEIAVFEHPDWDEAVYDGFGLVNRTYFEQTIVPELLFGSNLTETQVKELSHTERFEITLMTQAGQYKGDIMIVDHLEPGFHFAHGSAKTEVHLAEAALHFIGLTPRHGSDSMMLDIQSLINLKPFFTDEYLKAQMLQYVERFAEVLEDGTSRQKLAVLAKANTFRDFASMQGWWLSEFLASGGELSWFPGAIRAYGRQAELALKSAADSMRFPAHGGRYYIAPVTTHSCTHILEYGEGMVERDTATYWVDEDHYRNSIMSLLGGCDGDDAVWVIPFSVDGERFHLIWRSPNELGEYVVLKAHVASDDHDGDWPEMPVDKLPKPINERTNTYGELQSFPHPKNMRYSPDLMKRALSEALTARGVLGQYINTLMVCLVVTGELPQHLPARTEAVIDGCVKEIHDLSPVRDWCYSTAYQLVVTDGHLVPVGIADRIETQLPRNLRYMLSNTDGSHWFDRVCGIHQTGRERLSQMFAEFEQATEPPAALSLAAAQWTEPGIGLYQAYQNGFRAGGYDEAEDTAVWYISMFRPELRPFVMLGLMAHIYANNWKDTMLWGKVLGHASVHALRAARLLTQPVWHFRHGLQYEELPPIPTATNVQVNQVWFQLLLEDYPEYANVRFADIPAELRSGYKQLAASIDWDGYIITVGTRTYNGRPFIEIVDGMELGILAASDVDKLVSGRYVIVNGVVTRDGHLLATVMDQSGLAVMIHEPRNLV